MAEEIKVKLSIEEDIKKTREQIQSIREQGGFKGEQGAKREAKINQSLSILDAFAKETSLTNEQIKQVRKAFSGIYDGLVASAKVLTPLSEAANKLQQELDDLQKKLQTKLTTQTKGLKATADAQAQIIASSVKMASAKNPTGYGFSLTNIDKLRNYAASDKQIAITGNDGQVLTGEEAKTHLQGLLKAYDTTVKKQKVYDDAVEKATKAVNEKTEQLNQQLQQDANIGAQKIVQISSAGGAIDTALAGEQKKLTIQQNKELLKETEEQVSANDNLTQSYNRQTGAVGKALKQLTVYGLIINNIKRTIRSSINTVKELDKNLTEQAMVTGRTRKEIYGLLSSYQQIAATTGSTTKEVAQVSTQFLRQGKTAQEALTLTNAAISAAKVAGISAADSVNYLTTALNGFRLSASEAMNVSDKFAAIAAKSATSYDEIATALSKVASQASLAGMSIDYTTALLAKGLETTREAPETMGTALKTIIARMREMTDYGETLEGDTDINNVETQLAYVGIALKDANGELRSTEDVLDDLGKKWDSLNSNQQAAVAKALAGTRQQSRLIAMMSDYERVTELQEIAQRSQGATLAQMSTYMEGMDAALNKVKIAWESIIRNATNSDAIISIIDGFSGVLDTISQMLENTATLYTVIGLISAVLITQLGIRMKDRQLQRSQLLVASNIELQEQKTLLDKKKITTETKKQVLQDKERLLAEQKITRETYKQKGDKVNLAKQNKLIAQTEAELQTAQKEYELALKDEEITQANIFKLENQQLGAIGTIRNWVSGLGAAFAPFVQLLMIVPSLIGRITRARKKDAVQQDANNAKEATGAGFAGLKAAISELGVPGIAIGLAFLAAVAGIGIAFAVSASKSKNASNSMASDVDKLSNEIYTLNKQINTIDSITSAYDDLDKKLIKTKDDVKAMNEELNKAADSLSSDKDKNSVSGLDKSEQEVYNSLQTATEKLNFLQQVRNAAAAKIAEDRKQQLQDINKLSAVLGKEFETEAKYASQRDALYALNNNSLYEYIDTLTELTTEEKEAIQETTQAMLEQLSVTDALKYANTPGLIEQMADALKAGNITDLVDEEKSLKERVAIYKQFTDSLTGEVLESFKKQFQDFDVFAQYDDSVLTFIEDAKIGVKQLNDLYTAYKGFNINTFSQQEWQDGYQTLLETLSDTGNDINKTIQQIYGDYLEQFDKFSGDYDKAWNELVNALDKALGTTMLNMGQNIDKVTNTVSAFYEKAQEWQGMSDTEKTQFMADYADIFASSDGLLTAIENGNYTRIREILKDNKVLADNMKDQLREINQQLAIENARIGEEQNKDYIRYLEEQKKRFEDMEGLFEIDLKVRLEQEQKQLDLYKSYLEKQKDELTKSLDKRKEAYQNYFDEIKQVSEDEDYEEEADQLLSNLNKISSTTDAATNAQRKELETKLADLEKERLETLRERAQEAIMTNLDDSVTQINDKFEELLNDSAKILALMTEDMKRGDASFLSNLAASGMQGMTALQAEDYFNNTLRPAYSGIMDGIDWNNITTSTVNNQNVLNINGQTPQLTTDEQNYVYNSMMAAFTEALKRIGKS